MPPRRVARRVRSAVPNPFGVDPGMTERTASVLFGSAPTKARKSVFDNAFERVRSNFAGEDVETDILADRFGDEVFTVDPTKSINPPRPRTKRAGWVRAKGAPTGSVIVQFRDGAVYEYSGVPYSVWRSFRRVQSPGRLINRTLNSYPYRRVSG